jgi:KUP system potassium uptake protein
MNPMAKNSETHFAQEISMLSTLAMAFQTLGVVYGDMGTSPLYVFSDVFSKVPIKSEVEILGALSLVMYTIALIPFAKYVFIVLKANDNGEGMNNDAQFAILVSTPSHDCRLSSG